MAWGMGNSGWGEGGGLGEIEKEKTLLNDGAACGLNYPTYRNPFTRLSTMEVGHYSEKAGQQ